MINVMNDLHEQKENVDFLHYQLKNHDEVMDLQTKKQKQKNVSKRFSSCAKAIFLDCCVSFANAIKW